MKKRIVSSMFALLLSLFAFALGYVSGFSHARLENDVFVARDMSDSDSRQSATITAFDPYFTKHNRLTDRVR